MEIGKRREEIYSNGPGSACHGLQGRLEGGVTGELVLNGSSGPSPGMDRSVLKNRSREESAREKSASLIRRPAQDREQP